MRKVKVAATQMSCSWNRVEVIAKAEKLTTRNSTIILKTF